MPLSSILRSSSSYRKVKRTGSQSQAEDSESQPVDMVLETQPDEWRSSRVFTRLFVEAFDFGQASFCAVLHFDGTTCCFSVSAKQWFSFPIIFAPYVVLIICLLQTKNTLLWCLQGPIFAQESNVPWCTFTGFLNELLLPDFVIFYFSRCDFLSQDQVMLC